MEKTTGLSGRRPLGLIAAGLPVSPLLTNEIYHLRIYPQRTIRAQRISRLADGRAAVADQSEEDSKERREKNGPGDAARPGAEHGNQASLDLVLID